MVTFAQTTEPASEIVPASDQPAVPNSSLTSDENSTGKDTSGQAGPPAGPAMSAAVEVDIQSRFNELRGELLDDRAGYIDWWLSVTAIVLTFFGIVVAIAGVWGFRWFREIKTEARNILEEIKNTRDKSHDILQDLTAKTATEDPDKAKRAVVGVSENPTASPIHKAIGLAVSLQQQGNRAAAIEKWRAVAHIEEGSDNNLAARAWFSVGYLIKDEDPEDALAAYAEAIRLKPDYAEAYNNRGAVKDALGRHDDAIADYDEAIRLKPDYAEAYNNRGAVKDALGRHDDAIADYDEAIRLKPDYAEAYANRGNVKTALGRHDDAIADQDEAIRLKPDYAEAYNNRGTVKGKSGRYTDAIADYDEAIRLQPDLAIAYNNRGAVKGKSGRYTDAIADCDEAIRLKPDYAEAYYNRGNAKKALGLKDEARKAFETTLELARNANNAGAVAQAEQSLRDLNAAGGS